MRFAYIDSQGKEVGIPSVEALALRIELGAITPSTQLHDAAADRWAPASEHEIFRTLTREIQEKGEGFVAPPPPSRDVDEAVEAEAAEAAEEAQPAPAESPKGRAPNPFDAMEGRTPEPGPGVASAPEEDDAGIGGFDLTLAPLDESEPPSDGPPAAASSGPPEAEGGGFDFGDLGSLEVESSSLADKGGAAPAAFSGESIELEDMLSTSYGDEPEAPPPSRPSVKGPASLWDDDGGDDDDAAVDDEELPSWAMAGEGADALEIDPEQEEADRRAAAEERRAEARARFDDGGSTEGGAPRAGDERAPRARPADLPATRRSDFPTGLVGALALLLLLGGGGWFGWSAWRDRSPAGSASVEEPPVSIPQIPAELDPPYQELSGAAFAATLESIRALREELALAPEPPGRWLSGEYMANAGDFAGVPAYFDALRGYLADVRASDSTVFNAAFAAGLDEAALDDESAALLRRRAAAGFSATGRGRREVYRAFDAVLDAATSLHAFLLANQSQIDFAPATGGMSRDPVLEAVPATPAIGDEMWDRVDDITAALDALGALDRVTTDLLVDVLVRRLEATGVR